MQILCNGETLLLSAFQYSGACTGIGGNRGQQTYAEPGGGYDVALLSLPEVQGQPQRHPRLHGGVEGAKFPLGGREGGREGGKEGGISRLPAAGRRQRTDMRHILFSEKLGTIATSSFSARNSTSAGSMPAAHVPHPATCDRVCKGLREQTGVRC